MNKETQEFIIDTSTAMARVFSDRMSNKRDVINGENLMLIVSSILSSLSATIIQIWADVSVNRECKDMPFESIYDVAVKHMMSIITDNVICLINESNNNREVH